jgi:hypothetical protein
MHFFGPCNFKMAVPVPVLIIFRIDHNCWPFKIESEISFRCFPVYRFTILAIIKFLKRVCMKICYLISLVDSFSKILHRYSSYRYCSFFWWFDTGNLSSPNLHFQNRVCWYSQNLLELKKEVETIRFKCETIEQKSELSFNNLSSLTQSMQVRFVVQV